MTTTTSGLNASEPALTRSMGRRFGLAASLALALLGFGLNLWVAAQTTTPPVMDSYEYFNGAWLLARGAGLQAPYVWNYLDGAQALPTANFTYWMPLPALIAAPFIWLAGPVMSAPGAQPGLWMWGAIPMALLGALVPVLAAWVAQRASGRAGLAWLAGGFALATGLYLIRWSNVDSYAPFAASAALAFCCTALGARDPRRRWAVVAGIAAGLAHLSRADGVLVPGAIGLWLLFSIRRSQTRSWLSVFVLAYAATLAPWLIRNLWVTGSPLGLGGARTLWLLAYDELFSLDPDRLTAARFLASDLGVQAAAKAQALAQNLTTLWVAQGQVLALPLALVAAWVWRRAPLTQLVTIFAAAALAALSLAFTYPGPRGAFLHSGGALVPFIAAGAVLGLDRVVTWAARKRGWSLASARPVFLAAGLIAQIAAGAGLALGRPLGDTLTPLAALREADALIPAGQGAAVANPPAFFYHTGRPAIVVPDGSPEDLAAALDRFELRFVILDVNHAAGLDALYSDPAGSGLFRLRADLTGGAGPAVWLLERRP